MSEELVLKPKGVFFFVMGFGVWVFGREIGRVRGPGGRVVVLVAFVGWFVWFGGWFWLFFGGVCCFVLVGCKLPYSERACDQRLFCCSFLSVNRSD